ncbi:hypothetical protein GW17_00044277 [Ensete ventricosum]|nr:hypothetical protein GW17_00044277 [Ensete ventricosum]
MAPMNSLMLLFLTAERSLAPTDLLGLLTSTPSASDEVVVELACGGRHRLGILLEVLFLGKEGENVLTCSRAWHKYWAVLKVGWTCMVSERRAEMASDDLCEKWEEELRSICSQVQAATNALPEEPVETQPTEKKEAAANEEVVEVETTKVEAAADAVTEKVDNPVVEVDEPETEPVSEIAAEEMAQQAMPELPKTDVPSETDITGDAPVAPGEEDTKEVAVEVEPKAEEKEEELAQEEIPEPLPADVRLETVVTGEAPEAPAVELKEDVNVREVEDEAAAA